MYEQIQQVVESGYKPVIIIDADLFKYEEIKKQLEKLANVAIKNKVMVFNTKDNLTDLLRKSKLHVFQYGHIPLDVIATIKRRKGVVVSGNLAVA